MHIVIGRFLKFFLWFAFAVLLGSFLVGFAKFGFQPGLYIQYLNGIEAKQLWGAGSDDHSGASISGDVVQLSGDGIYDPNVDAGFFAQSGVQTSGGVATGTESFGFIKDTQDTGTSVDTKATLIETGSVGTGNTGDKIKNLLNLVKSREK
ncbi:MAG: hypothetical protein WCO66_04645 [Candidatus Absconditabacteria bacterium]